MNPKISIIVPIYNVEKYLSRCLESLLNQKFTDAEIICINDGSTDQSGNILHDFQKNHPELIVMNKRNNGVSEARNDGLRIAKGEYIGFVDPDDWIHPAMYHELYETAVKENADIVMSSYVREFGTHSNVKKFSCHPVVVYRDSEVQSIFLKRLIGPTDKEAASPENLDSWGTVWSKLYRAELIKNHHLYFTDLKLIGSNEDTLFNIHAVYHAHSIVFINKPLYHYWRANESSVTTKYNSKLTGQFLTLYQIMETFIKDKNLGYEYTAVLKNRISLNTLGLGLNTISKSNKSSFAERSGQLKEIISNDQIKRALRQFNTSHCSVAWKTFFFFAKTGFVPGLFLMLTLIEFLRKTVRQGEKNESDESASSGNHHEPRRA
ncbi:glycosyltransferase [Metabacillus sp. JX24]|uniref:glycosyltransferase n=1 Tax=Metabacillus sp. JX24 TaxID=3240759 RepID=UPI0035109551